MTQAQRSHNAIIQCEEMAFHYEKISVLREVNLALERGRSYIVIGPNGGGKTTLLRLIMGFLTPTSGKIIVTSKSIGYLPQTCLFDSNFPITTLECVLMGGLSQLSWYGKFPKKITERAMQLLDLFALTPLQNQPIGNLSGGQRQKAFLARALLSDPQILILDEPMNGLDAQASKSIHEILRNLRGEKTLLIVTHLISDIMEMADQIICVSGNVSFIPRDQLCRHHAMGVYHEGNL